MTTVAAIIRARPPLETAGEPKEHPGEATTEPVLETKAQAQEPQPRIEWGDPRRRKKAAEQQHF